GKLEPELYDPVTGTFSLTGRYAEQTCPEGSSDCLETGLIGARATLLPDGKVLIAAETSAQLYDPISGTFSLTGAMTVSNYGGRPSYVEGRTASLLTNGTVLLTGGLSSSDDTSYDFADTEIYDPSTGEFTAAGNMTLYRSYHTATVLSDGTVLIA